LVWALSRALVIEDFAKASVAVELLFKA
jgi:hypothetical protein